MLRKTRNSEILKNSSGRVWVAKKKVRVRSGSGYSSDPAHSAHGISQLPLVQDPSVLKMKNPFKMFNEKSCVPYLGKRKCPRLSRQRGCLSVEVGKSSFGWKVGGHGSIGWVVVAKMGTMWSRSPCAEPGRWCAVGKPPSCSNTHHPASRAPIQLHLCPHLTQFGFQVKMFLVIFTLTKV